jgi:hypothetical protein
MNVLGSSEQGRVWVSTYRRRPPGQEELEGVENLNKTQSADRTLSWADRTFTVGSESVPGRVAFVPASDQVNIDQWAVLLFGSDYSASMTLDGLTPDELILALQDDDAGYTDFWDRLQTPPRKGLLRESVLTV